MTYLLGSVKRYLKDLAARVPAPGGGSAAALSAAMAAGLVAMVCQFTLGKEKYRKYDRDVKVLLRRSLYAGQRLSALMDADVRAYRAKDMDAAIRVPGEVCVLSFGILKDALTLMRKGNRRLASDALLAGLLAGTSFMGALFYVEVNVAFLKEKAKKHGRLVRRVRALSKKIKGLNRKAEVYLGHFAGR